MYDFVGSMKFDRLGVFRYSHEEGTLAGSKYADTISEKVKTRRMEKLLELQQTVSLDSNKRKRGQTMLVLVEGEEGEYYRGRTEHDSPEIDQEVLIPKLEGILEPGGFYDIRITDSYEFDLIGSVIEA